MSSGLSTTQANAYLNSLLRGIAYVPPAGVFVQVHVGAPGPNGTANVAAETVRKAVTMAAPAGGVIANSTQVQWTLVPAVEDWTDFTLWDQAAGGSFLISGLVVANPVAIGDTATAPPGTLVVTLPVAS